jgi:hypothetical protein
MRQLELQKYYEEGGEKNTDLENTTRKITIQNARLKHLKDVLRSKVSSDEMKDINNEIKDATSINGKLDILRRYYDNIHFFK